MPLTCVQCQRTNPAEAIYCYYDGFVLPGHEGDRPLHAGSQPFPSEFVFPSGRRCRNFDEFAMACNQEWSSAVQLLQGGYIESFLSGIGRADLAQLAQEAAAFPDPQRGLDMFIEKLPSTVVEPPRLHVEPQNVNLGQLKVGEDRRIDLTITNLGMRLLYGSVSVENTPWIAIGEAQGVAGVPGVSKTFHCEHELSLSVQVQGKKLKASKAPLVARILVDTNGGSAEVVLTFEVPVKPFPSGVLAGCRTQRQLAEAAFKNPRESAPLFESGEIAMWYADNGWTYPVIGPPATGLAALQQFFEACGLTQAPRVRIDPTELRLHGVSGDRLERSIRVKASDKKPAFAWAVSDQPWIVPGRAVGGGTTATIPLEIPSVPYAADGSVLAAKVTVTANGRQKFVIPVRLQISNVWNLTAAPPPALPDPSQWTQPAARGNGKRNGPRAGSAATSAPDAPEAVFIQFESDDAVHARTRRPGSWMWLHVLLAALLGTALLGVLLVDLAKYLI